MVKSEESNGVLLKTRTKIRFAEEGPRTNLHIRLHLLFFAAF